eukprot:1157118-Pelagomonas_calceolata.AAC.9
MISLAINVSKLQRPRVQPRFQPGSPVKFARMSLQVISNDQLGSGCSWMKSPRAQPPYQPGPPVGV